MSKKRSQPSHGEGPSRFEGRDQHGWAPDVDDTTQQPNPSAHRSFHPGKHAPEPDAGRAATDEDKKKSTAGTPLESTSRRGEEQAGKSEGMHDKGPKGRSQRPSGSKDASAFTGVDPQDPPSKKPGKRSGT
ncbi:hypothetical protein ABZ707_07360 [Streptomyces sp. NPDC006923]|uniref:hypothetical protein n=1 Tax=Streptomyces sp. NPDC006923 TaxID=3155355 RepID=UPI0033C49BA8